MGDRFVACFFMESQSRRCFARDEECKRGHNQQQQDTDKNDFNNVGYKIKGFERADR